ncbi:uncharacterized protein LOC121538043 isoform X2 [Coregonus clupeaformis]|nr:uncharacterized protein LOC121538043 isoform X2 [Coregonus clupeaformis]XP_041701717.1 uncharacterized protein LOC121538043 isoform X2 [Coregonus clupeaformis]XP_041701718.1 uncharacterized protein LOC121538043 isoform X2 [Coregonus clupeaformis]
MQTNTSDLAWIPASFKVISRSNGYISGTVKSEEELGSLLENHKRATYTSFNTWSEHKKDQIKRRLLWQVEDYADDVPVCVEKRAILACQHGKASKRHSTAEEQPSEHVYSKKRLYVQRGKKVDCPAKLFIRHVTRYDTFSVKGDASRAKKQEAMKRLKEALTQTSPATSSSFIHVKLPIAEAHQNHIINEASCFKRKIHPQENMGQDRDTRQQEENMGQDGDTRQQEENMGQDGVRENHITAEQCALRDELNKIMDATYLCQDIETLQKTKEAVADIRKSFIGSCPKGNGLPLLSKENQMMRENNQMLRALPPRVRKGKLKGQFEIYWGGAGGPK